MALPSELVTLVESERQLDTELAETRAVAAELVRRAHEGADAMRRRLDAEIAEASERLRVAIDAEQITTLAGMQADARRQVALFEAAMAERTGRLADCVVARLVSDSSP